MKVGFTFRAMNGAAIVAATTIAALTFGAVAPPAAMAATRPSAAVSAVTEAPANAESAEALGYGNHAGTYPTTDEEAQTLGLVDKIKDLIKKFPEIIDAVKKGWDYFKKWFDGLPWVVQTAIRALSPALTLYELYQELAKVIG